jgi:hypothetical protein
MHRSIHVSSAQTEYFGNRLPLTKENLENLQNTHLENNDILERYCQEISRNSARDNTRSQSTPPFRNDEVVASRRILPFPYHNDSMFLPTAEQLQYHLSSAEGSSTRADSSSAVDSNFLISRPHSTTVRGSNSQYSMVSSTTGHSPARRSLPARLDHLIMSKNFSKQRFLLRTSSLGSSSAASSSLLHDIDASAEHEVPLMASSTKQAKKPWIKRILKFFHHSNKKTQQQKQYREGNPPVWYCQYSTNPTSRFEKYYNQQQMVIVS